MTILGFMEYFANRQKLGLKASNLPGVFLEGSLSRFSGINAQHFMNLFPKVAKITRKSAIFIIKKS